MFPHHHIQHIFIDESCRLSSFLLPPEVLVVGRSTTSPRTPAFDCCPALSLGPTSVSHPPRQLLFRPGTYRRHACHSAACEKLFEFWPRRLTALPLLPSPHVNHQGSLQLQPSSTTPLKTSRAPSYPILTPPQTQSPIPILVP